MHCVCQVMCIHSLELTMAHVDRRGQRFVCISFCPIQLHTTQPLAVVVFTCRILLLPTSFITWLATIWNKLNHFLWNVMYQRRSFLNFVSRVRFSIKII